MKKTGLVLLTVFLFLLSIYIAYQQGYLWQEGANLSESVFMNSSAAFSVEASLPLLWLGSAFLSLFNFFLFLVGGNMMLGILVLALFVELVLLYPHVNIQLMQKKIHLFHKKLVDRFNSGELSMSATKRELDVLYSVNQTMHWQGAWLVAFQVMVFALVFSGLYLVSLGYIDFRPLSTLSIGLFDKPFSMTLPVVVSLSYLLHSLIKIHVKQREDYISQTQIKVALGFAILMSATVFFFAANFAILLSVYVVTQISFSTARYLLIEAKASQWGKLAQKQLIKLLHSSTVHKNKLQHLSRKVHHMAVVRHVNFHLLEEGLSMSLAFVLMLHSGSFL